MSFQLKLITLFSLVSIIQCSMLVAFWGQNLGGNEKNLEDYCNDNAIDIIIIQYLSDFDGTKTPKLNLKSSCKGTWCPGVGGGIRTCQSKGKKVLLSLGGPKGLYGVGSPDLAKKLAQQITDIFFTGASKDQLLGDVKLDGIDLSIQNRQGRFYSDFVNELRDISKQNDKKIIITGTAGCDFENDDLKDALQNSTFDLINVKLYDNDKCDSDPNVNLEAWDNYAKDAQTKLIMGISASRQAVKSGYLPLENVKARYTKFLKIYNSLFGIAINDASVAFADGESFGKEISTQVHSSAFLTNPSIVGISFLLLSIFFHY